MTRIASLDTVRGLAAWSVAVPHFFIYHHYYARQSEPIAILAVEIFFVLSGYVLAPQILLCLSAPRRNYFLVFWTRRWMRTIPPYFVALVVATILFHQAWSADFLRYATYTQNLFGQHNSDDYYQVAWSLSVEEWFYLSFPISLFFSLILLARVSPARSWVSKERAIVLCAISYIVAVTCIRSAFGDSADWGPAVRRVVAFRVDAIAYGFLLYLYVAGPGADMLKRCRPAVLALAVAMSAFAAFSLLGQIANQADWAKIAYPFVAAAFSCSCLLFAIRVNSAIAGSRALRAVSVIGGRISYSVYLFHIIFLTVIGSYFSGYTLLAQFCLYIGATGVFTLVFFRLFEKPILLARPRFDAKEQPPGQLPVRGSLDASAAEPVMTI
ncbi:MAG TPA: acyltransferase [Candidatus Acidoferrales bacterium]